MNYDIFNYVKKYTLVDIAINIIQPKGTCFCEFQRIHNPFELMGMKKVPCYAGVLKIHVLEILAADNTYTRSTDYFAVMSKSALPKMCGVIDARPKVNLASKLESAKLGLFRRFVVMGREYDADGTVEMYCDNFEITQKVKYD